MIPSTFYRGRFAPSPTGPLHFGSLIAALASYLDARAHQGQWLVRIEDLDPPRVVPGAADGILRTLEALGFEWDGRVVYQSRRIDAYHAALHDLRSQRKLYACACSRRDIADSAVMGIEGYVYPGTCRSGLPTGRPARAWRLSTHHAVIGFEDAIQGRVHQDIEHAVGDFGLYRADHAYAYHLAAVVDDAAQGITDAVRGADLLESTPRQIYLQHLLGLKAPRYAHVPVAVDAVGEKLSKQTRAAPLDRHHPQLALITALGFLGQRPPRGLISAELDTVWNWARAHWKIERVPRSRTRPVPAHTQRTDGA